ncbi:MAG: hypothetical protein RI900_2623 [Actinomycetota bacterium]
MLCPRNVEAVHPGLSPQGLVKPDFLILGAQKSATTSLAMALAAHPDVLLPKAKEAHHFGAVSDADAGGDAYRRFFAEWSGQRLIGDATPNYLVLPAATRQIMRVAPEVKAITVLRNPIDRAYSAYWHGVAAGVNRGSFEKVLAREPKWMAAGRPDFRAPRWGGCYSVHIDRFLREGFPRSQWLFLLHDEVVARPVETLTAVQEFLGLEPLVTELPHLNTSQRSVLPWPLRRMVFRNRHRRVANSIAFRSRRPFTPPPMAEATRRELQRFYAPLNAELGSFLGRDLSHWV